MPDPGGATGPVPEITIAALEDATMALWRTVASVARSLEDQQMRWCLVGGLMVGLFAIEAGQRSRPTKDIDILGDARERPSATERLASHLLDLGASRYEISGLDREKGFRFELDGQVIDVLAPDGLGKPAKTSRQFRTIQIPGGSQALNRIERAALVIDGLRTEIFRPTLLGALLLKSARAADPLTTRGPTRGSRPAPELGDRSARGRVDHGRDRAPVASGRRGPTGPRQPGCRHARRAGRAHGCSCGVSASDRVGATASGTSDAKAWLTISTSRALGA